MQLLFTSFASLLFGKRRYGPRSSLSSLFVPSAVAVALGELPALSHPADARRRRLDTPGWVPPKLGACIAIHLYGSCCYQHGINTKGKAGKHLRKVAGSFSVFESNLL